MITHVADGLIKLTDNDGDVCNVTNNGLDVYVQDQHTETVSYLFTKPVLTGRSLASNTTLNSKSVTLNSGASVTNGMVIMLKENGRMYQGVVTSIDDSPIFVLDSPLDYAFTTSAIVCVCTANMDVDGSGTSVEYTVSPPAEVVWDITYFVTHIEDSTAMDDGTFGGRAALTNGVVMRLENGITKNIGNAKTNGDIAVFGDREYVSKPPAGTGYALNAKIYFQGHNGAGVTVRLTSDDMLKIIIQDDLTGLDVFYILAVGHVVE